MNLVEKYYVGVRGSDTINTNDFPLAFATPYGTDKSAKKRIQSVDSWSGKTKTPNSGAIIDNEAVEGFRFEKSVSRWSTSNKLFRINDPRGFTLEISAVNLADILLNCTIEKGLIQDKLIWTRNDSNNWLTRLDHPEYLDLVKPKFDRAVQIGDEIETSYGVKGVYIGKVYINTIRSITEYKQSDGTWSRNYRQGYIGYRNSYDTRIVKVVEKDPKPWNLLGKTYSKPFFIQRDISKCKIVSEKNFTSVTIPYGIPNKDVDSNLGLWGVTTVLFENKQDALQSSISESNFID